MRTEIVETCPHCEKEVELMWDILNDGYEIVCPYCGHKMMLCSECPYAEEGRCDWNSATKCCTFSKNSHSTALPRRVILDIAVDDMFPILEQTGTIDYVEKKMSTLEGKGIKLNNAKILDEDDPEDSTNVNLINEIFKS